MKKIKKTTIKCGKCNKTMKIRPNIHLSSNFINKTGWINEGPLSFCPQCNVEHIKD